MHYEMQLKFYVLHANRINVGLHEMVGYIMRYNDVCMNMPNMPKKRAKVKISA